MYWKYVAKRLMYGVMIFVILMFVFSALFNATMEQTQMSMIDEQVKADVQRYTMKGGISPEDVKKFADEKRLSKIKMYHLDEPIFQRIVWKTWDAITFNFGNSTIIRSSSGERNAWLIVSETIPRTVLLFTVALFIEMGIGISLGLQKAQKAGSASDKSTSIMTMIVYGMPSWWVGMLMIMIFAYTIMLFPSGGLVSVPPKAGIFYFLDILYHMVLPVTTLVIIGFWGIAYLSRNIFLGVLQDDYIMAARARGIPENKILYGHTLRTSSPPIVTMVLLAMLASVSGNIIFEGIFSWPGMGNLYWIAVQQNDIPVLMALLATTTALYIGGLVLLDVIYGLLDPRIKVGEGH